MKEVQLISNDYPSRMKEILDESWKIFKSQFVHKRNDIDKEAPFQLQFASIIKNVGELYTIRPDEQFYVNRETKFEDIKNDGRPKIVDITMGFKKFEKYSENSDLYKVTDYKCAIELKFKTKAQGAQNIGRINVYQDLESLEHVCRNYGCSFGKFYMITDDVLYTKVPKETSYVSAFNTSDGYETNGGTVHKYDGKGGKTDKYDSIELKGSYRFEWEHCMEDNWYFLEIDVTK